jgi:hypothetical protein
MMAVSKKERQEFRNLTQSTPEWLAARRGRVTASRCSDVIRRLKSKVLKDGTVKPGEYSADRYNYLMELVVEHLTGRSMDTYVNQAMEWGIEQQPFAQAAYEMRQDVSVESVGLIIHPEQESFAASPDGTIDQDGLVEFKCPTTRVHLEYLKAGVVPDDYIPQMNAQLACMPEREYCDFVSFDPRVPFGMQLFIRRHYRDKGRIGELECEVETFLGELASELLALSLVQPIQSKAVMPSEADEEVEAELFGTEA